ncbi:hypothetical protein DPMN_038194 [Dreissena polymorpha]|uniref:Uncharacterized protein n=1 Tax=Dreissena polymorpha TaxID=45954 RepID=A0A9D4RQI4_DREPO|nr:hypothetical protein DPMN_038194 [Dreissena polymorpha]
MELAGSVSSHEQEEDVTLILSSVAKQFAHSSILFPLCLLWGALLTFSGRCPSTQKNLVYLR